jgi:uncharacterized Zn finger protein
MSMAWRGYDDFDYPPPSHPREAKGGIKAQSKRGTFGERWWAKRWIAVLESFHIGARLGRGRSYARRGQVLSIVIDKGLVTAKIQGSRPQPYDVTIRLKTLSEADWQNLANALAQQAMFAAKLLAGEMPQDIEQPFSAVGLSLFPGRLQDLETACYCPDWSNPCKHIAAVYYLLGEEFDRDPSLLFTLRGKRREELLRLLGDVGEPTTPAKAPSPSAAREVEDVSLSPEPLTADIAGFWGGGHIPDGLCGEVRVPPVPAALPKRLGSFPFWRGAERFLEAIEPVYVQASPRGLAVFLGEADSG